MTDALGKDPPAKQAAREESKRKWRIVNDLMRFATEEELEGALRLLGIAKDSPSWKAALNAWRAKRIERLEGR